MPEPISTGVAAPAIDGAAGTPPAEHPKKRAVILVHGIGNQSPMETIRSFVEAVWTRAPELSRRGKTLNWSLRDKLSENLELRRITTDEDVHDTRTDFFEFYWANMMEDTRWSDVIEWIWRLLARKRERVPDAVALVRAVGIVVSLLLIGALALLLPWLLIGAIHDATRGSPRAVAWIIWAFVLVFFLGYLRRHVIVQVAGDAARYLTAAPSNIGARTAIRLAGLELLKRVHCDPAYDRVIMVGHSLGTVVAYDLISFYWSQVNDQIRHGVGNVALKQIEEAGAGAFARTAASLRDYRVAQRAYFEEIRRTNPDLWKISDFVTLGSPLTHAHFLLVPDDVGLLESEAKAIAADWQLKWWSALLGRARTVSEFFRARALQRDFPLCPPITEKGNAFTYERESGAQSVPHHAAPFAAVRWTNIFAPCRKVIWGDVVGGPLAPLFGPGIKDVGLTGDVGRRPLAHTHYWDVGGCADDEHLQALRAALNLPDYSEATAWCGHQAELRCMGGELTPPCIRMA